MQKLLHLEFIPRSTDAALLVLRLSLGLSMLLLHGWMKLTHFSEMLSKFPDPIMIGRPLGLSLTVFAEVGCSALLVLGLFTRAAAFILAFNMAVAFFLIHHMDFKSGAELPFLFLTGYVVLVLAGAGKFSIDRK